MDTLEKTGQQGLGNFWEQAMHTDPAILQAVMQGKSDAFPQDVAMSALMAQNKLRTAAQGKPQPQQPTVKQRMMASMAPMQQPPQQPPMQMQQPQQAAEPPQLPEDSGIAQHAKGGSVGWAEGGILGFDGTSGSVVPSDKTPVTSIGNVAVPSAFLQSYVDAGNKYNIDPRFLIAQTSIENSKFNPTEVNSSGHFGLGQHSLDTWQNLGYDPADMYNPNVQIDAQAKLLRQSINMYNGDVTKGLKQYDNGGDGVIVRNGVAGTRWDNPETQNYPVKIGNIFRSMGSDALVALTGSSSAQAAKNPQTQGLGSTPPAQTTPNAPTPATDSNYLRQVIGNMASTDGTSMNTTSPDLPADQAAVQGYFAAQNNPIILSSPQPPANAAPAGTSLYNKLLDSNYHVQWFPPGPTSQAPQQYDPSGLPGPANAPQFEAQLQTNMAALGLQGAEPTPMVPAPYPPANAAPAPAPAPAVVDPNAPAVVDPNAPTTPQNIEAKQPGAAEYYDTYIRKWLDSNQTARNQAIEQGKGIAALKAAAEISKPGQPGGLLSGLARGAGAAGEVAGQVSQEQFLRDKEMGAVGLGALQNQGMMAYRNALMGLNQQKLSMAQHTAALKAGQAEFDSYVTKNAQQMYGMSIAGKQALHDQIVGAKYQELTGQTMPAGSASALLPTGFNLTNTAPGGINALQLTPPKQ